MHSGWKDPVMRASHDKEDDGTPLHAHGGGFLPLMLRD